MAGNYRVSHVAYIILLFGCSHAPVAITPAAQRAAVDTSFVAMQERGKQVMGVDQYMSTHHFADADDGGSITLTSDSNVVADIKAIRQHLAEVAKMFAAGDFTDPSMVHVMEVPGTAVMKRRASSITYTYSDVPGGGRVRIVTHDAEALKAVHEFLEFQRTAHHTHDMDH